ncbi:MAG: hypothetical protein ISF22_03545, partial [Methanomassiliicoccus sp.]|nr:hypothetical protein [Methanomassiliicoccus sp.]
MNEKVTLRACPYCGSMDTHPALLFGGPLPWVDHNDGGYICRNCGRTAVPLDFDSIEDLKTFQKSIAGKGVEETTGFRHIPLVPVDTLTLFRIPYIDLPIAQVADVVEVEWDKGYRIKGQKVRFSRYWRAVHGPRYSAKEIALLDLSGIQTGRPNFDVLKSLIKSKYQVWLDLGVRDVEDVFDAFAMDVARTIIGTMTAPSLDVFEEAFDLSDHVVPCIQIANGKVLWPGEGPKDLSRAVAAMADIGFEEVGIIDLPRIGRRQGVDPSFVEKVLELDIGVILGGGVTEQEVTPLRSAGLAGVFMDPFTPVIG